MSTLQIDRLLETCVKKKASDLHLAVGKPPVLRLHGNMRELQTKVLEPEDTVALMKSITPERIQQEYEEAGERRLWFRLWGRGPLPRRHLQAEGKLLAGLAANSQQADEL